MDDESIYRRQITKLAGGAVIDWNSGPVLKKIERAVAKTNKRGALRVKRKAISMVRKRAYETGALMKSIKMASSKYSKLDSIVMAGGDDVPYARAIERGRFFKEAGTRIAPVPFMRQAAADTRKWMKPRMKEAIRRAIR